MKIRLPCALAALLLACPSQAAETPAAAMEPAARSVTGKAEGRAPVPAKARAIRSAGLPNATWIVAVKRSADMPPPRSTRVRFARAVRRRAAAALYRRDMSRNERD